jgi:hypothetical protein
MKIVVVGYVGLVSGACFADLSHSEFFHRWLNIAPSNPGTKHLVVANEYVVGRLTGDITSLLSIRLNRKQR